jgi:hypothetical protein
MAFEIKQKGEYNNADLRSLDHEEEVQFTLETQQPFENDGQWGKFYVFKATFGDTSGVSFIVSPKMRSKTYGVFLLDELCKYGQGDVLKVKRHNAKTKKGVDFTMYEVIPVSVTESNAMQQPQDSKAGLKQQLVDMLQSTAGDKVFANSVERLAYANEQLKKAGVDDETLRNEIALMFSNKS